mgnify:CR=1 FL=1|jgi:NADH:ubiquinone oxidoreductase subunit 3 (subunit A)
MTQDKTTVSTRYGVHLSVTYGIHLYVTYVCSKCGCQVLTEHIVRATNGASGGAWNRKSINEQADYDAASRMTSKLLDILEERKDGQYRTAKFNCKCGKCGHKEPWSKLRYGFLTFLTILLSIAGVFAILGAAMIKDYIILLTGVCALLFLLTCYVLYRVVNTRKMEKLTAALPVKSLPAFSQEFEEVLNEAVRNSENEHRELYIDKKLQNRMKGVVNK